MVVTGGASGIGYAIATGVLAEGGAVSVLDIDPSNAPSGSHAFTADVSDDDSVVLAVEAAARAMGGIDVLVNNAAVGAVGTVEAESLDEWRRVLDVNVLGVVRVTRAALPHLRRSAHPAVVNLGSIAVKAGLPDRALYSASKGAVFSLTLAMAADHVREGIRFNCVNPGTTDTPWVGRLIARTDDPVAERAALEGRQPLGRLVRPEEVAAAVLHLGGPSSGATTGTSLAVDGGVEGLRVRPR
jgi:NAD(P)-dependent dehydrogenase (short-subunit alcohol dehydrogenase family)